jgi:hypothetical protein
MHRHSACLILISGLLLAGCEKAPPAAQSGGRDEQARPAEPTPTAAEQAIEAPPDEPQYEEQGGIYAPLDYLAVVMRAPAQAKLVVSQSNMRTLGQAVTMHKMAEDGYPESLEALAQAGRVDPKIAQSPGNAAAQIVYLRPTDQPGAGELLAFDPVGYPGGKYVVVTCGGGGKTVGLDDLKAAIRAREGKVIQPQLTLKP